MPGNELSDFFNGIPLVTRYWFSGTILLSLIGKFGIVDPGRLILLWDGEYKYQLWRPLTALLFFPVNPSTGFHFLINLYFLYNYSSKLENGVFIGRRADYVFLITFCLIMTVLIGYFVPFYFLMEPMVLNIIYIWSQFNRDVIVQFWFGMQFKAMYFPWVLVIFNMIVRGGFLVELVGIIVGHMYCFFAHQYPEQYGGPALLRTPNFFYKLFPNERMSGSMFGPAPRARREPPAAPARFPGRGNTLGGAD